MVEVGVVVDKGGKSGVPKKIMVEPEIDWDGLDITQQGNDSIGTPRMSCALDIGLGWSKAAVMTNFDVIFTQTSKFPMLLG